MPRSGQVGAKRCQKHAWQDSRQEQLDGNVFNQLASRTYIHIEITTPHFVQDLIQYDLNP